MTETIQQVDSDIDSFDLIMLANENEPHCEVKAETHAKRNVECSHSVTALLRYCRGTALSCTAFAIASELLLNEQQFRTCSSCDKPLGECWHIIPV
jgi:hypothetical protein